MVDAGSLLKAVHALAGLWFLVGLGGRWIALGQAARASEVGALRGMLAVSDRFERIVISGGGVVLLLRDPVVRAGHASSWRRCSSCSC